MDKPDNPDYMQIYTIAAYLSPLHQLTLSPEEKSCARQYIKNKLSVMNMVPNDAHEESPAEAADVQTDLDLDIPGMDLVMDLISSGAADTMQQVSAFDESFRADIERLERDSAAILQKIRTTGKSPDLSEDILEYWNRFRYSSQTKLPDLACNLLVAPASSVPSERLFSIAGELSSGEEFVFVFYICLTSDYF